MKPRGRSPSRRRGVIMRLGVVAAVALKAAACGDAARRTSDTTSDGGGGTTAGRPVPDGAVSVANALEKKEKDGPSAVRGYVISRQGLTQLCQALAQSYPPQCGGGFLTLDGYDTTAMDGAYEDQGVRWSSEEVVVVVERRAGRFVVVVG